MIKNAGKLLLVVFLVVSMFSYAMFQGGFVSWFLFYSIMPLLFYSFAIVLFPMNKIRVERKVSRARTLRAWQPLEVTVTVNKTIFPLFYLVVEDILPRKLNRSLRAGNDAKALFFPLFQRTLTFTYEIPALPRGEHLFSDIRLKTGDPFGFLQKQTILQEFEKIIVYPQIQKMDWTLEKQSFLQGSINGKKSNGDVTTVVGLRDYIPGDRLSWLDWKSTAKRNKLLTKQFEHQKNKEVQIVLDNSVDSYKGDDGALFEKAVSAAASIARQVVAAGGVVSMPGMANSSSSRNREQQLFYFLAKMEANDPKPFSESIGHMALSERASLIVITPRLTKALLYRIEPLIFRNRPIECFCVANSNGDHMNVVNDWRRRGIPVHLVVEPSAKEG